MFTQATTQLLIVFLFQHLPLSEVMLTTNKDLRNTRQKLQELKGHIEGPKCAIVKEVLNNALRIEVYDFQLPSLKHLVKGTAISVGAPQSVSSKSHDPDKTPNGAASHTPPPSLDGAEGTDENSKSKYTSDALADKKRKTLSHLNEKSHHIEPKAGNASTDKKSAPKPLTNDGKLQTSKQSESKPKGSVDDSRGEAKESSHPSSMTGSSKGTTKTVLSEASGNVKMPDPNITEETEPDDETEAKAMSKREPVDAAIKEDSKSENLEIENSSTTPPAADEPKDEWQELGKQYYLPLDRNICKYIKDIHQKSLKQKGNITIKDTDITVDKGSKEKDKRKSLEMKAEVNKLIANTATGVLCHWEKKPSDFSKMQQKFKDVAYMEWDASEKGIAIVTSKDKIGKVKEELAQWGSFGSKGKAAAPDPPNPNSMVEVKASEVEAKPDGQDSEAATPRDQGTDFKVPQEKVDKFDEELKDTDKAPPPNLPYRLKPLGTGETMSSHVPGMTGKENPTVLPSRPEDRKVLPQISAATVDPKHVSSKGNPEVMKEGDEWGKPLSQADAAAKSVSGKDDPNPAVIDTPPPDPSTPIKAPPSPQSDNPSTKVGPQTPKPAKREAAKSSKAVTGPTGLTASDAGSKRTVKPGKPKASSPSVVKPEPGTIPDAKGKSTGRTPSTKDEPQPKPQKTLLPKHEKESIGPDVKGKSTDRSSARKDELTPHKPPAKRDTPEASAPPPQPKRKRTLAVPEPMSFYSQNSSLTVHALVYDITALQVEVIANAANIYLQHSGGVAKAISNAAGKSLQTECKKYIKTNGPLHVTSNMLSSAGNLPCKGVIHAAGPAMKHYKKKEDCFRDVHETFAKVIHTATSRHFLSLGIPAISSGKLNISSLAAFIKVIMNING